MIKTHWGHLMCSGNEGKIRRPRQQEVKSVKDTEYTEKNQMDILELRNMTTSVKARRMRPWNRAEERVIEMEDRMTEITQPERQRKTGKN